MNLCGEKELIKSTILYSNIQLMKITRISTLTGDTHTMELDITQEQIDAHKNGAMIQHCMSNLTPDEREFYISGSTKEEWDAEWPDEGESEDPEITKKL